MTSKITLTAKQLGQLLRPIIPHAEKGGFLPILNSVVITSTDGWLSATATDRYTLAMQRVRVEDVKAGIHAVIPLDGAKSLLSMFGRVTKSNNPEVSLTFAGNQVKVEAAGTIMGGFSEAAFSIAYRDGEYPQVTIILAEARKAKDASTGPVAYNPSLLTRFTHAQVSGEPLVITPRGNGKPALVQVGDDFIACLMPVRHSSESTPAISDPDTWDVLAASLNGKPSTSKAKGKAA